MSALKFFQGQRSQNQFFAVILDSRALTVLMFIRKVVEPEISENFCFKKFFIRVIVFEIEGREPQIQLLQFSIQFTICITLYNEYSYSPATDL